MDRPTRLPYLVSGHGQSGRVSYSRITTAGALTKAKQLLEEGYLDVRVCTPHGRIVLSSEFDQLEE